MKQRPAFLKAMQPTVFLGSAAVVIGFVIFGGFFSKSAGRLFDSVQSFILEWFGWFYIASATAILVFVGALLLSRFGSIRLGGPEARPEFSYFAWFTMLFSAGMGTGLVFWGVAEPMSHFLEPPEGTPETMGAANAAIRWAYFHWGLHPWAVYALFGLSMAYFHFRFGLPLAPRSLLYPLIGERIHGLTGHLVDILATVGTLFGVATSLGLGAMQINTGISQLFPLSHGRTSQVIIIAVVTGVATISVVTGIRGGIRRLSQFNLILAAILFLFVFLAGPTLFVLEIFVRNIGGYFQQLPETSFWIAPDNQSGWQEQWTLFYWSWWISWSPFVGVFTARISKGRTIREFITTVLFLPTSLTFLWFAVFGGAALHLEIEGKAAIAHTIQEQPALALHELLGQLPWPMVTSIAATLLVIIFFVTSSDSGSLVDDMVTSGGHPSPPRAQRVFWALAEGTVAAVLLLTGGLQALRTASLTSGLPMTIFLLVAGYGLWRALRADQATPGVPPLDKLSRP